jgi:Lrp/AsnC family transcriptional regulator for asnA, asnC and gidA
VDNLQVSDTDIQIIRCLQDDARSSVAKLAGRLRMPESTVRHRLNALLRHGLIEFVAMTNPLRLGFQIWVILEIQAQIPKIRSVANRLAAVPEIYFVGVTTGNYNVFAAAVFRSNHELVDFMTRRLAGIRGIVRTTTANIVDVVKRTIEFRLPATPRRPLAAPGSRRARRVLPSNGKNRT